MGSRSKAWAWLLAVLMIPGLSSLARAAGPADPAVWGVYAQLVGTQWEGDGGKAEWQWGPDNTIVESRTFILKTVIRAGATPGELVSVYGGGLHTFDGRIAADGSVLWIRRGRFLKMPSRASIVDGRFVEELVKLDDANQVASVSSTVRLQQTGGPTVDTARVATQVAAVPVGGATATPAPEASAPPAPAAAPPAAAPLAAAAAPTPAPVPDPPKKGPRQLSAAELAALRTRMGNDKVRRAQNLSAQQAAAEQQRQQLAWQLQQSQIAAAEEESWEDEPSAPTPNLAEVFLSTLGSEMAKNQAQREEQDAFVRDLERQAARAEAQRQREQQRQQQATEQARRQQYAQQAVGPSPADLAQQQAQQRAADARERQLAADAAAERARQQARRAQQQAAATVAPRPAAASTAAAKPLRFVLLISMRNLPGDKVNPTCYSNVITRDGPPGWGAGGFLPPGSGEQARQAVYALKSAFIAQCRASGREITSDGNFNFVWNQTQGDEQRLPTLRAKYREDVSVSL